MREPAVDRALVEGADFKQPIAVLRPADRGQHLVLALLVIAGIDRPSLQVAAEIPAERDDDRTRIKRRAVTGEMQHARRDDAGAVDHDADDFAAGLASPRLIASAGEGGAGSRRSRRKLPARPLDHLGIERRRRAVVDDDNLVILGGDMALVGRRKRIKRPHRLARHVVHYDDN